MNQSVDLQSYAYILNMRKSFKRVSQLSWNIARIEKAFEVDSLEIKDLLELSSLYSNYAKELYEILNEINQNETKRRLD